MKFKKPSKVQLPKTPIEVLRELMFVPPTVDDYKLVNILYEEYVRMSMLLNKMEQEKTEKVMEETI